MKRLLAVVFLLLAGCASIPEASRPAVHHVVLCWLKESGNVEQRDRIIEASKAFRSIPGVVEVRVGEAVESDRKIVDDSFDVAVSISFADRQGLAAYLTHPDHKRATREVLLPLVEKVVVYDFEER